jgi:3-oxoadipate enol-lactonase
MTASPLRWTTGDAPALCYSLDGAGPRDLIAIHELGGSLHSFADLLPHLAGQARVLRYDQRGAGLSEKPRAPYAFADHVSDLERVIAAAGIEPPYHLVGLAAGAAIAIAFAHRHPGKVGSLMLCAPALAVSADRREYLSNRTALAAREGMRAVEGDTLARSYPARYRDRDPARFAAYRACFLANDPVGYGHANMAFADVDIGEAIAALHVPCLMLAGEFDALRPPEQVKSLAERIQGAQFAMIDSGHIMPVQAPQQMAQQLLSFMRAR